MTDSAAERGSVSEPLAVNATLPGGRPSWIDAVFDENPTYSAEERHCRYQHPHVPHDADWNDDGRQVWHPCPGTPGDIKRRADKIERRFSRG